MKKIQVKAEVWFSLDVNEFEDDITENDVLEYIKDCSTLGDLDTYFDIANQEYSDLNICETNSIWIEDDNGNTKFLN